MEPHAFVMLLVALCVLAPVSTKGNINGSVYDDAGIITRNDTGTSTIPQAHDLSRTSPVPDTGVAPSLGGARRRAPFAEKVNVVKKTKKKKTKKKTRKKTKKKSSAISCSLRNKCSVGNNTAALNFNDRNCFCDVLCHTYGDCCKDAAKPARRQVGRCRLGLHHQHTSGALRHTRINDFRPTVNTMGLHFARVHLTVKLTSYLKVKYTA